MKRQSIRRGMKWIAFGAVWVVICHIALTLIAKDRMAWFNQALQGGGSSGTSFLLRNQSDAVNYSLNVILAWDGIVFGLLGIVAFVVTRNILRDSRALEIAANEVSKGNLEYRVTNAKTQELGAVADQFSEMTMKLHEAAAKDKAQTEEIRRQQELAESLLLNVLPRDVADELKAKGAVDPRYYEDVTIIFADFQGFTLATEKMAADELVNALHQYFSAFDAAVHKYGLEKLKTIGDSYMCVAGLPVRRSSHAVDAVLAAFEMLEAAARVHQTGLPAWPLRIGVHTGPVISGVVGLRKFAFDIWGESVNFASRVESSGHANRINLSASTFSRVKDFFVCEPRGKVKTKEDREFDMYFAVGVQNRESFASRYRTYFQADPPSLPQSLDVTSSAKVARN